MILSKLPKELSQLVFLMLDGASLHRARQVCRDWNQFIVREIWNSRVGRKSLEARLKLNWKREEPTESEESITFHDSKAYLLGMSDQYIAVKVMRESSRRITRRQKMLPPTFHSVMIIVNLENKERQEILIDKGSEHSLDRVYFMSSAVIGELKSSWGLSLGSMRAWDIGSQEEIFSKEYPTQFALSPLYDANSQEVVLNSMVNGNPGIVRLNTDDDNSVKETFFDSSNIGGVVAFSSPYLLCHHPSLENTFNVCKIVENKVEIVSTLEIPDLYFNKLAISKQSRGIRFCHLI